MGQQAILKLLNDTGKKFTTEEIADILELGRGSVTKALGNLLRYGFVTYDIIQYPSINKKYKRWYIK